MSRRWKLLSIVNDIPLKFKFLIIYLMCVLLPILCINGLFYMQDSKNTERREMDNLRISLNRVGSEIMQMVNEGVVIGNAVSADRVFNEMLEYTYSDNVAYYEEYDRYLRDKLGQYPNIYPYISWIGVYTSNPTLSNGGSYFVLKPSDLQSKWYQKMNEKKDKVTVTAYLDTNPMNPEEKLVYVSISRKLDNFPDLMAFSKYLRIDIRMDKLLELFDKEHDYLQIKLVDEENQLVLESAGTFKGVDPLLQILPVSSDNQLAGLPGNSFVSPLSTASYMLNWRLIGNPEGSRIAEERKGVIHFFIWLTLISTIIPTILIYIIMHSFNFRVRKLSKHMQFVKNERFEPITMYEGKDEIGNLLRSFNLMTGKIRNLITDVYKLEIQKKDLELERVQAELKYLQSQVDPHFLFNTLNAILVVCKKYRYEHVTEIIQNLSQILRRLLSWKEDLVTVEEELSFTEMYLQIEKFRFQDRFHYELSVDESVLAYRIPKMSIQSLVENSCKHGLQSVKGNRRIRISVERAGMNLLMKVEDNGIGMNSAKLDEIVQSLFKGEDNGKNIGLRNVYRRLNLFYAERSLFHIESIPFEKTSVTIQIPLSLIKNQEEAIGHV
ncbi:two-component system sensor histidine kinase YesM [Paenibacillus sp. V4I9]|uniref:sensor histidine kinase n=1 Tax=Paenibacillus sp. V4I9 TaxID=3042308 RepID=UPI00277E9134|nr:histidine kinase [Paenibacillus sp. V4I9]MDQ0886351.1 two-component system sensor histidine kinase YesM [Paenibacillus sp. V4I9]